MVEALLWPLAQPEQLRYAGLAVAIWKVKLVGTDLQICSVHGKHDSQIRFKSSQD